MTGGKITFEVRDASPGDLQAIADIYNQGIEERQATFETNLQTADALLPWLDGSHPVVIVEYGGAIVGFASSFRSRERKCFEGIEEFSVYVRRDCRGRGVGTLAMRKLIAQLQGKGY